MLRSLKSILSVLHLLIAGYILLSCSNPYKDPERTEYSPVLMTREQLENSVSLKEPRTPKDPGKIYHIGNYIFINEKFKGIHMIDNHDPSSPLNIGFLTVPGNIDIAVKDDVLYLDNAVDMIAVKINADKTITVTKRIPDIFPSSFPPDLNFMPEYDNVINSIPEGYIIVGWELKSK
jgi:hypothetical protein